MWIREKNRTPRRLEWTPQTIAKFWDGLAKTDILEAMSFARLAGPVLMEFLAPWITKGDRCLDFGGGSGHFVEMLVHAGYQTASFEPSAERSKAISARLADNPNFIGTVGESDLATFDFVICTEVIEHIPVPETAGFMRTLVARVAPGGRVFLTTPFDEDLVSNEVYCPRCDHIFHRWQHMRNWQADDIRELMEQSGLSTEWLGVVGFDDMDVVREFAMRRMLGEPWPWTVTDRRGAVVPSVGRGDHIVYFGRIPAAGVS